MKRLTFAVVCLSGFVIGPACQAIVGIEDRSEAPADDAAAPPDDAADSASMDVVDASPDCALDDVCLAPDASPPLVCPAGCLPGAPIGWNGPSAIYDGAEAAKPADCPTTYTQKEIETHVGIIAADATCSCGSPGLKARFCKAKLTLHSVSDCSDVGTVTGSAISAEGSCLETIVDGFPYYRLNMPTLEPGTCFFPDASTTVPAPVFTKVQLACGLVQKDSCPTRPECIVAQLPAQPYERLCIYKDGHELCPSGDYKVRFAGFKQVDDTRGCTTCTATVTDGGCGTSWGTSATKEACASEAPTVNTIPSCYPNPGKGTLVNGNAMGPAPATCTGIAGGAPTGTAKSAVPVTFCCNL